jgi:hypothetical protein
LSLDAFSAFVRDQNPPIPHFYCPFERGSAHPPQKKKLAILASYNKVFKLDQSQFLNFLKMKSHCLDIQDKRVRIISYGIIDSNICFSIKNLCFPNGFKVCFVVKKKIFVFQVSIQKDKLCFKMGTLFQGVCSYTALNVRSFGLDFSICKKKMTLNDLLFTENLKSRLLNFIRNGNFQKNKQCKVNTYASLFNAHFCDVFV